MRFRFFAAALALALAAPAAAQDARDFMSGVYASDEEACEQLKASGLAGVEESVVLTAEGLHASDYSCDFVDLKPNKGPLEGWVGLAVCEEPDAIFPNVVAIAPYEENGVRANFLSDPFVSEDADEEATEETAEAEADADAAAEEAAPEEEAAAEAETEPEAEADAEAEETTDEETEETDENVYFFCPGVTKQDLAKGNPN